MEEYSGTRPRPFGFMSNNEVMIRKKKSKNKRRFDDEQIKSLETMFESETRLEPRKKLQVARELGLHPRQVAIWFQNKRARWKSKQLEHDYNILQSNYDNLASRFESLKKEKQALLDQLEELNDATKKPEEAKQRFINGNESELENEVNDNKCEESQVQAINRLSLDDDDDDDKSLIKAEIFGVDEANMINTNMPNDSPLATSGDWGSLDSDGLFHHTKSNIGHQWWDFWS
ncbi:hypothetical protein ACFE04_026655 [Oxalis oulophora]